MAIGVFGLKKAYKKQVQNLDNNNFTYWPESTTSGYFAGGFGTPPGGGTGYLCNIDRLDFSTETVTIPSQKLTQARQSLAAVSNAN